MFRKCSPSIEGAKSKSRSEEAREEPVEFRFLGASPDVLIQCACCGPGVVEIKSQLCTSERSFREAATGAKNFFFDELCGSKLEPCRDHAYTTCTTRANHKFCDNAHVVRLCFMVT